MQSFGQMTAKENTRFVIHKSLIRRDIISSLKNIIIDKLIPYIGEFEQKLKAIMIIHN